MVSPSHFQGVNCGSPAGHLFNWGAFHENKNRWRLAFVSPLCSLIHVDSSPQIHQGSLNLLDLRCQVFSRLRMLQASPPKALQRPTLRHGLEAFRRLGGPAPGAGHARLARGEVVRKSESSSAFSAVASTNRVIVLSRAQRKLDKTFQPKPFACGHLVSIDNLIGLFLAGSFIQQVKLVHGWVPRWEFDQVRKHLKKESTTGVMEALPLNGTNGMLIWSLCSQVNPFKPYNAYL